MADGKRALFLDWGGTLARTRDNRTVVDPGGHPQLQPNVPETLARVRTDYDACFIVSNQARVSKGEITEAEVLRRFAWANEQLGRPFTAWLICPHDDADGCACRKPKPGMFLALASAMPSTSASRPTSATPKKIATPPTPPDSPTSSGPTTSSTGDAVARVYPGR